MASELFSSFRIPYDQYVDLELVFSLRLHISPEEMGRMFFYDILLLYKRYEQYLQDEEDNNAAQVQKYEEENGNMNDNINNTMSSMQNSINSMVGKMPGMTGIH